MSDASFPQNVSLAPLLSHNPDTLTGDSLGLLLHNPDKVKADSREHRSPHASTERSPLPHLIEKHELTDALEHLETKGLRGENALFALTLAQNLMRRGVEL